ncbi:MAG: lipopolysaccharide transport periplasmic protein LptA [Verrucomicrobiales bacterium]|jgi:lipopolysaccharide export system protein LptA|nr:lipopolysaccharide transport periplasmic protein LptA [Verrucomicrobiales bacterium]
MKPSEIKKLWRHVCCAALCGLLASVSAAQEQPAPAADEQKSEGVKETTVDSDTFRLDLSQHTGVFTGNVVVIDPSFELNADEMTLFFDKDNKIERMTGHGNINLKQGDRQNATSREIEYFVAEKKVKLTGNPIVQQGDNKVTGGVIYLYPGSDRMDVDGRSKVRFYSNKK